MTAVRERYRLDLVELQAACEANYARLMRLLPDMRGLVGVRRVALSQGEQMLGVLALEVTESCPYTSTLQVRQELSLPWLPLPHMEVPSITMHAWPKWSAPRAPGAFAAFTPTRTRPCTSPTRKPSSICFSANGLGTAWPVVMSCSRCFEHALGWSYGVNSDLLGIS